MKRSLTERAFIAAVSYTPPNTTLAPGPGAGRTSPKAAIRRCLAAWNRGYKASQKKWGDHGDSTFAAKDAGNAYCNAMPILSGQDGVRDFIACAAHGILIGAIPPERSGQVLYAAQVALSIVQSERKSSKSTTLKAPTPSPLPPKTPAPKKKSLA